MGYERNGDLFEDVRLPDNPINYSKKKNLDRALRTAWTDPGLYQEVITMYRDLGFDRKADKLVKAQSGSLSDRKRLLDNLWNNDKVPRREFVARAGDYLARRAAGQAAEEERLKRGRRSGRASNILKQQATANSGAPEAASPLGRTRGLISTMGRLGQSARLG